MALLPNAEVEQVGATAVPGALTKGDLDVLVRVSEADFSAAIETLRGRYAVHQPHNWTSTLASFKAPTASDPEVGVQLVVSGSSDDGLVGPFRDALIRDSNLLAEYNALKQRLDGADYDRYTERKAEFIERALRAASSWSLRGLPGVAMLGAPNHRDRRSSRYDKHVFHALPDRSSPARKPAD